MQLFRFPASLLMDRCTSIPVILLALTCWSKGEDEPPCPSNHFKLEGMEVCHPLLECADIDNDVVWNATAKPYNHGSFKNIYRGAWQGRSVAVLRPLPRHHGNWPFLRDLELARRFGDVPGIKDILGFCFGENDTSTVISPLYEGKTALDYLAYSRPLAARVSLAKSYLNIIHNLHTMDEHPWVLCDSHSAHKMLTQFKVVNSKTDNARMVLVDLDSLQYVNHSHAARCAFSRPRVNRSLGQFYAPEQFWEPHEHKDTYIGHDEKTDNWKIPIVVARCFGCRIHNSCQSLATCEFSCEKIQDNRIRAVVMALIAACRRKDPGARCSTQLAMQILDHGFREDR
eukprot:TRINITY_DN9438_c0_g3_i1.p1 TRINITY_DN9438_c0_g3~~TRINITY_DN9438_c0_g3_i1.p1  ORF type:complete len:342 (+),score=29.95 TRINITY_DN9438_c0_g3_i1:115-1140(+)